jgi:hypothetical protein
VKDVLQSSLIARPASTPKNAQSAKIIISLMQENAKIAIFSFLTVAFAKILQHAKLVRLSLS